MDLCMIVHTDVLEFSPRFYIFRFYATDGADIHLFGSRRFWNFRLCFGLQKKRAVLASFEVAVDCATLKSSAENSSDVRHRVGAHKSRKPAKTRKVSYTQSQFLSKFLNSATKTTFVL